jgi:lysophospholipase L1-like esterase
MKSQAESTNAAASTEREAKTARKRFRLFRGIKALWLLLGSTLIVLVVFELLARAGFAVKDTWLPLPIVDARLVREGYAGELWVTTHFQEYQHLIADWQPYVNYRQRPFRGETITVLPGGVRATWNATPPNDAKPFRIWILGGSSAWGLGARDDFTLPSLLSKELSKLNLAVEVTNFGEIGYVSTQEYIWLSLKLREGNRPDLVILYSGANDILSALQNGLAGWPQNESKREASFEAQRNPARVVVAGARGLVEASALNRLASALAARLRGGPVQIAGDPAWKHPRLSDDALAESVLNTYAANCRLVEALGEAYGFQVLFYWQPAIFSKRSASSFERDEIVKYNVLRPLFEKTYLQFQKRSAAGNDLDFVVDLSRLFDDDPRTLFADFCHITEVANAVLAEKIAKEVAPKVVELRTKAVERRSGSGPGDR